MSTSEEIIKKLIEYERKKKELLDWPSHRLLETIINDVIQIVKEVAEWNKHAQSQTFTDYMVALNTSYEQERIKINGEMVRPITHRLESNDSCHKFVKLLYITERCES